MAHAIPIASFDPNVPPYGMRLWGMYDGNQFHVSARRQSIIAKANNRGECSVWALGTTGVWVLVGHKHRVQAGFPCGVCQRPLQSSTDPRTSHTRVEGRWDWVREDFGRKIADPLRLLRFCAGCLAMNQ